MVGFLRPFIAVKDIYLCETSAQQISYMPARGFLLGGKTHRGVAFIAEHFLERHLAITTYPDRYLAVG